jgi:hypothetical protein
MGMTTLCQQVLRPVKGPQIVLVLVLVVVLEKGLLSAERLISAERPVIVSAFL